MNSAAVVNSPRQPGSQIAHPVNQLHVTRSEWIKFASLRSNWISVLLTAASIIGLGALLSYVINRQWDTMGAAEQATFDPVTMSLAGVNLGQLILAVMGVLLISGEYSNGMIRASLAAVPKRLSLLAGKITISAGVSFVVSLVSIFVAFLAGQYFLGSHGVSLDAANVTRVLVGTAFYLMSVSVMATALGFVTRSTAGGIAAIVALLLVLPVIGQLVPYDWATDALNYLPGSAGGALATSVGDTSMSTSTAVITLISWMVVSIAAAAVLLQRRDV